MKNSYADVRVEKSNETYVVHTGRGTILAQSLRSGVLGRFSPRHQAMVVPGRYADTLEKIMVIYEDRRTAQVQRLTTPAAEDQRDQRTVPESITQLLAQLRAA